MTERFDAHLDGTDERDWATSWVTELEPIGPLDGTERLVVLSAHPDDETLGAGGLIAAVGELGIPVTVIVATDGEASHPDSTTHSPAELAMIRRQELLAAIVVLHPTAEVHFLGLPDSALSAHLDDLVDAVSLMLGPATHLVTPWLGDRHPDHEACARAGAEVAGSAGILHWQFPIWAWHWGGPDSAVLPRRQMRRFHPSPQALERKAIALRCHLSQHAPLSDAPGDEEILDASMLAHFARDFEVFVIPDAAAAVSEDYFDDLYAGSTDPWGLGERFYEHRKRDLLLATLPRPRCRRAFEPGCATGWLTVELARRSDAVIAWDGARSAVEQAQKRVAAAGFTTVAIDQERIPTQWPDGEFDLIVLSEVGYYCADPDELRRRVQGSLAADGVLVACHWRHPAPDHPLTAAAVHDAIGSGLHRIVSHEEADFLLDVWTRDGLSVASTTGIVGNVG
jgi:LmbE family N-acetylglucosaminyl deacetylase/protein-L-isoaspartate O-methyltransferase